MDENEPLRAPATRSTKVDEHVGQRVRQRRMELGISMARLAEEVGVTFQQIQKYERGANRVSASRLDAIARVLDVTVEYFYRGAPREDLPGAALYPPLYPDNTGRRGLENTQIPLGPEPEIDQDKARETSALVNAYWKINDPSVRKRFLDLLRSWAPHPPPEG